VGPNTGSGVCWRGDGVGTKFKAFLRNEGLVGDVIIGEPWGFAKPKAFLGFGGKLFSGGMLKGEGDCNAIGLKMSIGVPPDRGVFS
jgi:hypothetical protein